MEMDLTRQIKSAEKQFKQVLEGYFTSVYNEKILPSHGLGHHRRVWLNACDLITDEAIQNNISDSQLPFSLIIACYLHDLGMSVEYGPAHGRQSSRFCRDFIKQYNLREDDYPGLLDAIENHDRKDYDPAGNCTCLNLILSVADDLDAFGITGIYRYAEIYSARGLRDKDLAVKIRENASGRFNHFRRQYGYSDQLVKKHEYRYQLLDNFFEEYEKELMQSNNSHHPMWRIKVIDLIRSSAQKQKYLDTLISSGLNEEDDLTKDFFFKLQKENFYC